MDATLMSKLSGLAFYGFYDPSKNMVTVHFFNEESDGPDIIAYLMRDMSWDIREITDESSELLSDRELVTILHEPVGIEHLGSTFDLFVRDGLTKMAREVHGDEEKLSEVDKVFEVFENNSYGDN